MFCTIYARLIFKVPKLIFRLSSAENYLKILSRKNYAKLSLIMIGLQQKDKHLIISFLGIHFKVDMNTVLQPFVSLGLRTFFTAVDSMLHNQNQMDQFERNYRQTRLNFSLNCQGWFTIDSKFYYMKMNLRWLKCIASNSILYDLHNLRVLSADFEANLKAESIPKIVSSEDRAKHCFENKWL